MCFLGWAGGYIFCFFCDPHFLGYLHGNQQKVKWQIGWGGNPHGWYASTSHPETMLGWLSSRLTWDILEALIRSIMRPQWTKLWILGSLWDDPKTKYGLQKPWILMGVSYFFRSGGWGGNFSRIYLVFRRKPSEVPNKIKYVSEPSGWGGHPHPFIIFYSPKGLERHLSAL